MTDPEKAVVAGLLLFFLGGSLLAAVAVVDRSVVPLVAVVYLLVAVAMIRRLLQAESGLTD